MQSVVCDESSPVAPPTERYAPRLISRTTILKSSASSFSPPRPLSPPLPLPTVSLSAASPFPALATSRTVTATAVASKPSRPARSPSPFSRPKRRRLAGKHSRTQGSAMIPYMREASIVQEAESTDEELAGSDSMDESEASDEDDSTEDIEDATTASSFESDSLGEVEDAPLGVTKAFSPSPKPTSDAERDYWSSETLVDEASGTSGWKIAWGEVGGYVTSEEETDIEYERDSSSEGEDSEADRIAEEEEDRRIEERQDHFQRCREHRAVLDIVRRALPLQHLQPAPLYFDRDVTLSPSPPPPVRRRAHSQRAQSSSARALVIPVAAATSLTIGSIETLIAAQHGRRDLFRSPALSRTTPKIYTVNHEMCTALRSEANALRSAGRARQGLAMINAARILETIDRAIVTESDAAQLYGVGKLASIFIGRAGSSVVRMTSQTG